YRPDRGSEAADISTASGPQRFAVLRLLRNSSQHRQPRTRWALPNLARQGSEGRYSKFADEHSSIGGKFAAERFLIHRKITRVEQIRMVSIVHPGRHSDAGIKPHDLDLDSGGLGDAPGQIAHAKQPAAGSDSEFDDGHLLLSPGSSAPLAASRVAKAYFRGLTRSKATL